MFSVAISIVHSWCPLISKMVDCYTCAEQQQQSSFLAVVVVIVVVIVVVVVVVVKCYMAPSHCVSAAVNHYRCPYCEKTCPNPSSLRIHVHYRHTEDRPYKCPSCNYWWEPLCAVNVSLSFCYCDRGLASAWMIFVMDACYRLAYCSSHYYNDNLWMVNVAGSIIIITRNAARLCSVQKVILHTGSYNCAMTSGHHHKVPWTAALLLPLPRKLCFIWRFFCLSDCHSSVCLLATSRKNYWSDLHENLQKMYLERTVSKKPKNQLNFGSSPHPIRNRAFFHNLAYISGNTDRIVMKILSDMSLDKEVSITF